VPGGAAITNRFRSRRFEDFEARIARLEAPVRVLDVGGTTEFWEKRGWAGRPGVEVVMVNLPSMTAEQRHENLIPSAGDATALAYGNDEFDVSFSNSVIEHLGTRDRQQRMAAEVRRVARHYYVQTPNYWFPVEPHFQTVAWQYLPRRVRIELVLRRRFGTRGPARDRQHAERIMDEIRLLRPSEFVAMFPGCELMKERIGPLTKSLTVRDPGF
jgi:Methyltransferase domain